MGTKIDQKKYLQKYLNPKKHKKKGQKKTENSAKRVNIIDDDIDVSQIMPIGDSEIDIYTTGEDAPQIAGIIDERPIDVQLKDKFKFNTQWKLINDDDGFNSQLIIKEQKRKIKNSSIGDESKTSEGDSQDYSPKRRKNYSDDENESTRKSRLDNSKAKKSDKNSDSDFSPPRNKGISSKPSKRDSSPFRKKYNDKESKYHSDSDTSPPRKKQTSNENSRKATSSKQSDSDTSPLRRNSNKTNKSVQDSDTSPPRKQHIKSEKGGRRDSDSDASPPRRKSPNTDTSPPRKKSFKSEKGTRQDFEFGGSPPRKRKQNSSRWDQPDLDADPPRKHKRNRSDSDTSPPRKSNRQSEYNFEKSKHNFGESNSFRDKKIDKKRFHPDSDSSPPRIRKGNTKNRPGSNSPKNVNVVKFNIRNPDQAEKKLDAEKRKIQEEKYATWGKGLKQVEERREKMDNDSHEMSKPLARYANDEDLESFLKEQEREGDPMLEYIRKQNKTEKQDDKPSKPKYEGAFMPNRFGIPPGYRWDGVDRSNGYESNWFNVQNSKKVLQEEAYKWSTDDM
ncbi:BUD13 homolog [Chrysoperla carnea]|uniref:BUD13 homolog n=1 Tax=Chrysoperla carnea TaxID=189513 RepID=UPI001D077A21|nr:BUD13 homolog [Chrysoperla carnea]